MEKPPLLEPAPIPQSVSQSPDYGEARDLMGRKKWPEAVIILRKVIAEQPGNDPAREDLARALLFAGRREEGLAALTQIANRATAKRRATLVRRIRVASRQFFTQQALQNYQDGLGLLRLQKTRAARERFEKVLLAEPDNVEVLLRMGQAMILDADFDSAAERLRLARRLNPFEPEIRLWLGRSLHQRGELAPALEELEAAANELEGSELAPVWYAEALASGGQRNTAIEILDEDVKSQPFHLRGILTLVRLRQAGSSRESGVLWSARKDLQLILSRYEAYQAQPRARVEGDLGLDLRPLSDLKSEAVTLLQKIESALEASQPVNER